MGRKIFENQKMILIVTESNDKSVDNVIEWLYYYRKEYKRTNVDSDFISFKFEINNNNCYNSFVDYNVWNRRGYPPLFPNHLRKTIWSDYLKKEQIPILACIEINNNFYGSYLDEFNNNKIYNLQLASTCGLKIPETIVTNNKIDLISFIRKNTKYITKSLYQSPFMEDDKYFYSGSGTSFVEFKSIPDFFASSIVQEYIEKEIEIRIFYFDNNIYSMAIFSQYDELTKTDFRNYNESKPNRMVPFNLKNEILVKINKFIKKISATTGSIDLIITPYEEYYFLENNPMGQYHWLSENCNYYIDKKIAEILTNINNG
jgi:hypothetical protein